VDRKNLLIGILGGLAALFFFMFFATFNGVKQTQDALSRTEEARKALQSDLDSLKGQHQALTDKVRNLTNEVEDLTGEKQKLQNDLAATDKEREMLKSEIGKLNTNLAQAQAAVEQAKSRVIPEPAAKPQAPVEPADSNEYWAGVLKEKVNLEMKLGNLERQLAQTRLSSEKIEREKGDIGGEIDVLKRENAELKQELEYNKKMIDGLTLDLAMEKSNSYEIKKSLGGLKTENAELRERFRSVAARKEDLSAQLAELKAKNDELENSLDKMQVMVKEKLRQVDSIKSDFSTLDREADRIGRPAPAARVQQAERRDAVTLPAIVIRPDGSQMKKEAAASAVADAASVVSVNKDNNFVIINHGNAQGVKLGDSLQVYDGQNQLAGELEIIQVRENIAAADIKKELQPLKVGFIAR